ncbi:MAG: hypothetical protein AAF570_26920, partial [Bacteroidota bacterium]
TENEFKVEEYYQLITMPFARKQSNRPELGNEAFAYIKDMEERRKRGTSHIAELYYYRLRIVGNQITTAFRAMADAAQEAETYLGTVPHLATRARFGEFALYRMVASLHLGEYEEGRAIAARCLRLYPEGSMNWMIFLEYFFLLCMHTRNYRKATETYQKVVTHPRFEALGQVRQEKWRIYEAFLKYMQSGAIASAEETLDERKFNIWKFLNDVPNYSKDKRGLNIAILILQVLFLLDRKDFDGIIQRAEALKVYCSRYLKRDENYRSNCFLKMVLIMEKKDFDYERTRKITEKWYTKLKSARISYGNNLADIEVVPYEQLWDTILNKLRVN